jgi:hypothetical protein
LLVEVRSSPAAGSEGSTFGVPTQDHLTGQRIAVDGGLSLINWLDN